MNTFTTNAVVLFQSDSFPIKLGTVLALELFRLFWCFLLSYFLPVWVSESSSSFITAIKLLSRMLSSQDSWVKTKPMFGSSSTISIWPLLHLAALFLCCTISLVGEIAFFTGTFPPLVLAYPLFYYLGLCIGEDGFTLDEVAFITAFFVLTLVLLAS